MERWERQYKRRRTDPVEQRKEYGTRPFDAEIRQYVQGVYLY